MERRPAIPRLRALKLRFFDFPKVSRTRKTRIEYEYHFMEYAYDRKPKAQRRGEGSKGKTDRLFKTSWVGSPLPHGDFRFHVILFRCKWTLASWMRYSRIRPITNVSTVSPVLVSITTFWWTLRSSGDS